MFKWELPQNQRKAAGIALRKVLLKLFFKNNGYQMMIRAHKTKNNHGGIFSTTRVTLLKLAALLLPFQNLHRLKYL